MFAGRSLAWSDLAATDLTRPTSIPSCSARMADTADVLLYVLMPAVRTGTWYVVGFSAVGGRCEWLFVDYVVAHGGHCWGTRRVFLCHSCFVSL